MMHIFRFFSALSILRISLRKLDRIRIKRSYMEPAQSVVPHYGAFD